MALNTLILIITVGGIIGWGLFLYTLYQIYQSRKKELTIIHKIKTELELVKKDLTEIN